MSQGKEDEKTYGIGAILLRKMGHKAGEGLGKEGSQGITKPLEGIMRPKSTVGLGYEEDQDKQIQRQRPVSPPESKGIDTCRVSIIKAQKELEDISMSIARARESQERQETCLHLLRDLWCLCQNPPFTSKIPVQAEAILGSIVSLLQVENDGDTEFIDNVYTVLACICGQSWLKEYMGSWDPWGRPEVPEAFFLQLAKLCELLHSQVMTRSVMTLNEHIFCTLWFEMVKGIFDRHILTEVDSAGLNCWSIIYTPELAIDALGAWWPIVPLVAREKIFRACFLPLIKDQVLPMYQVHTLPGGLLLHHIIFPWLEMWRDINIDSLFLAVLDSFESVLDVRPVDDNVIKVLSPWIPFIPGHLIESFCQKTVLPRLELVVKKDSSAESIKSVFLWCGFVPDAMLAGLLYRVFFPGWWSELYDSMTSAHPDYRQIVSWYREWRYDVFPVSIFSMPVVKKGFRRGLDIMNRMLDDPSLSLEDFLVDRAADVS